MSKTYKLNPMQRAFLPSLQEWVDGHELNHEWVRKDRVRDRTHFSVTIRKVGILDEYSERDKEDLEWITQEYYKWKKKPLIALYISETPYKKNSVRNE